MGDKLKEQSVRMRVKPPGATASMLFAQSLIHFNSVYSIRLSF